MKDKELKPCPFCSSDEEIFLDHEQTCFLRMLEEEKGRIKCYTIKEYDKAWNTRPTKKKVKVQYNPDHGKEYCIGCNEYIHYTHYKYCPVCGGEIDWENNK